jgi:hypothetical protein
MDWSGPVNNKVNLYTSTDLITWTSHGNVVNLLDVPAYNKNDWIGRPKVAYNKTTRKYVLFTEHNNNDGTGRNKLTFFTSDSPYGPFRYQAEDPYPCGSSMGDLGSILVENTQAYLSLTNDSPEINGSICIARSRDLFLRLILWCPGFFLGTMQPRRAIRRPQIWSGSGPGISYSRQIQTVGSRAKPQFGQHVNWPDRGIGAAT